MPVRRLWATLIIGVLILTSACDCIQEVSGTLVDTETGLPIAGAEVYKKESKYTAVVTDSVGEFKVQSISGGLGKCPPMSVVIKMTGYEEKTLKLKLGEHHTIKLRRN